MRSSSLPSSRWPCAASRIVRSGRRRSCAGPWSSTAWAAWSRRSWGSSSWTCCWPRSAWPRRGHVTREVLVALRMTVVTLVLTGIAYPLLVTGAAQLLFPGQANGSLVSVDGHVRGSELLGQVFKDPGYFQPRPSAAGKDGYDPTASSGSNLGPTSKALADRVAAALASLRAANPQARGPVPVELVTASGSGLD